MNEHTADIGAFHVHTTGDQNHGLLDPLAIAGIFGTICISVLLMLSLATGPIGSDDISYFRGATEILRNGSIPELHHHLGRKVFILLAGIPAALGGKIVFGALVNILYSAALEVAVAVFIYNQFGAWAALVPTVITGLNAVILLWSGTLIPDTTVSLFMFLSVVALYYALYYGRKSVSWVLCSGALAGLSYAVKEPGILLVPPAIASILLVRPVLRMRERMAWCAVYATAFGCIFIAEGLLQLSISGDFFYRYHAINAVHNVGNPPVPPLEFIRRAYWSVASIVTQYPDALLVSAIMGPIVWFIALLKRAPVSVFAFAGVFVGGFLIFGSTSFTELRPMPFQPRYMAPLFPLIAVSLAALFAGTSMGRGARWFGWPALVVVFTATSLFAAGREAGDLGRARFFKNAAAALEGQLARASSNTPIFVDPSTLEMLQQFMPQTDLDHLKPIPSSEALPCGVYLVDPYQGSIVRLGRAPHFEEIEGLPEIATFNLNPLIMARLFPAFGASQLTVDPMMVAVMRRKSC